MEKVNPISRDYRVLESVQEVKPAARAASHGGGAASYGKERVAEGGETSPWKGVSPTLVLHPSRHEVREWRTGQVIQTRVPSRGDRHSRELANPRRELHPAGITARLWFGSKELCSVVKFDWWKLTRGSNVWRIKLSFYTCEGMRQ